MNHNQKPVVVITPTTGKKQLARATESVANQTYKNIKHLIVVDGPEFFHDTIKHISLPIGEKNSNLQITIAPNNTGANGFYGHRIYAAYPHLVNEDYIAFLDEDNWYDSNHIETLVNKLENGSYDWVHSLRKVYINGQFLANDCCESIGDYPIAWTWDGVFDYLVDTSSYMFKRGWLIQYCQRWHSGWGGDRRFFAFTKKHSKFETTGLHTLNYELPDMNKAYGGQLDIFEKYNTITKERYGGKYPWDKT